MINGSSIFTLIYEKLDVLVCCMEDSPSTSKPAKKAFPHPAALKLKSTDNGNNSSINFMVELKKALFSPTCSVRTPTFRTKPSMLLLNSLAFIFLVFTLIFLFGNSHIHHSFAWFKNRAVIVPPDHFPPYYHLFHQNKSKDHSKINNASAPSETPLSDYKNSNSENFEYGSRIYNSTVDPAGIHGTTEKRENHDLSKNKVTYSSIGMNKNKKKKKKKKREKGKSKTKHKRKSWVEMMSKCDIYDGKWVKDNSPPLYQRGSCPHIDESFDCYQNGRPDYDYENFRWQPSHCHIPRLDGRKMLRFFKGKRVVYVGDSLNRNMWESMICLLMNSVRNKSRVFEASGRQEFKKEGAYSFLFQDYNISVEYIRSAFLVQEWEMPVGNGTSKKETLRLDLVEKSYETFRDADVLIFNTGNWWTHEKTSQGKGYYQEGNHVHEKLDVVEAFDKAMNTWARWIESNINPNKTHVFFRGYSFSHFSRGEWNTGGTCDSKDPIKHTKDLLSLSELSPPIPQMLDNLMERVKLPVFYLNVTRMTNYRSDAHPSLYRKPNMTLEEKRDFQTHQDCSHWCLPGVPDTWNQLMFAQLLLSHRQRH